MAEENKALKAVQVGMGTSGVSRLAARIEYCEQLVTRHAQHIGH